METLEAQSLFEEAVVMCRWQRFQALVAQITPSSLWPMTAAGLRARVEEAAVVLALVLALVHVLVPIHALAPIHALVHVLAPIHALAPIQVLVCRIPEEEDLIPEDGGQGNNGPYFST